MKGDEPLSGRSTPSESQLQALQAAAVRAVEGAAPLASIGASVLTDSGDVFAGAYIRGGTSHTTFHAEAVAVIQALAAGHKRLVGLGLYSSRASDHDRLVPCGTCLQLLHEHACGPEMCVMIGYVECRAWSRSNLSDLLPRPWAGRIDLKSPER